MKVKPVPICMVDEVVHARRVLNRLTEKINHDRSNVPTDLLDKQVKSLPVGDFSFINEEAGDWVAECDSGIWSKVAYAIDIERKDGVLTFTKVSCDQDGNWTEEDYWSSDEETPFHETEVAAFLYTGIDQYFINWAEYWLDCLNTGNDPLNDFNEPLECKHDPERSCLEAAQDNIAVLDHDFLVYSAEVVRTIAGPRIEFRCNRNPIFPEDHQTPDALQKAFKLVKNGSSRNTDLSVAELAALGFGEYDPVVFKLVEVES